MEDGQALPEQNYTSRVARCIETTRLACSGLDPSTSEVTPRSLAKENLGDQVWEHTCDKCRSLEWIREQYPDYGIEDLFNEDDGLSKPDYHESPEEHAVHVKALLARKFESDPSTAIAVTTHSSVIAAFHEAVDHDKVRDGVGLIRPVLIGSD